MRRWVTVVLGLMLSACSSKDDPKPVADTSYSSPLDKGSAPASTQFANAPPFSASSSGGHILNQDSTSSASPTASASQHWQPIAPVREGAFPGVAFRKVRAFDMDPLDPKTGHPQCLSVLNQQGGLCRLVRGPGVELQQKQVNQLLLLLRAPSTFGGGTGCFLPRHGFVFYDENDSPVAEVALCFECEMVRGKPSLKKGEEYSHGVAKQAISQFTTLVTGIGLRAPTHLPIVAFAIAGHWLSVLLLG